VLTEDPPVRPPTGSGGPEGLRIAAARAGQQNGDGADHDDSADGPHGDELRGNRPQKARRERLRRAPQETSPTVLREPPAAPQGRRPAPAATSPSAGGRRDFATVSPERRRPAPVSEARAKVLRQRRRRRRLLIAFIVFTIACTLLVGLAEVYLQTRLGRIKRVSVPNLSGDTPGSVMNVLLVGSDSRDSLDAADAQGFGKGEVGGQRSDTMMLLHIDPRQEKAAIISVPRDLFVPIAGTTYSDRVNSAFATGGPYQLVATIQHALGITINHYVEVDFVGFKDIVEAVGGVTMYIPYQVRDAGSGLDFPAGCPKLDGQQALAWVRSRKIEFLVNGTWQEDGRSDLGRIERQQDFIRRMMKTALSSGLTSPIQLNRLIGIGVKDVTFDSALSTKDLTALGRRFSSLDPDRVVLRTLPTDPADVEGKAVLKLQSAQAQPMIDLLNGRAPIEVTTTTVAGTGPTSTTAARTPPTTLPAPAGGPVDVKVRVLNGIGQAGAAGKAATGLTGSGFVVTDRADAPAPAAKTTISYATGQLAKAQLVQGALLTPAVLKEDATLKTVDVTLLLGADYAGLKPGVSTGAPVTTTAPATTLPPQIAPVPLPRGTTSPPC
jgi:LCP family protein required for cell wall assembly